MINGFRDIVGPVVVPLLGNLPECAIILYSGFSDNPNETIDVGIGALAGSTIQLLTIPWFITILLGRINLTYDGKQKYKNKPRLRPKGYWHLFRTGVQAKGFVRVIGRFLLLTCMTYVIIQLIIADEYFSKKKTENHHIISHQDTEIGHHENRHDSSQKTHHEGPQQSNINDEEKIGSYFVIVLCIILFGMYVKSRLQEGRELQEYRDALHHTATVNSLASNSVSISAAFSMFGNADAKDMDKSHLNRVLKVFFSKYDRDNSGFIDKYELKILMQDLGENVGTHELTKLYEWIDTDGKSGISFEEFAEAIPKLIRSRIQRKNDQSTKKSLMMRNQRDLDEDEFEVETIPEELRHDDVEVERRNILLKSFRLMISGTILVLIFSEPIVEVMSDMAERSGISAFYVSFAFAPLASNAPELVSAYLHNIHKTKTSVTMTFSSVLGAAILHNTLVLAIFIFIFLRNRLPWTYSAETLAIIFVEFAIGLYSQKRYFTLFDGFVILMLYPGSLLIVTVLQDYLGID